MEDIKDLIPSNEELILKKIKHLTFAKVLLWLDWIYRTKGKDELIYVKDLNKAGTILKGMSYSWVYQILIQFADVGLLRKISLADNHVYFRLACNGDLPLITKYVDMAEKTVKDAGLLK